MIRALLVLLLRPGGAGAGPSGLVNGGGYFWVWIQYGQYGV